MQVWAFQYNDCYHESSFATMSLHKTKEGAERAMQGDQRDNPNPEKWQLWQVVVITVEE